MAQFEYREIKTLILTGAGASVPFGLPAMANFLDKTHSSDSYAYKTAVYRSTSLYGIIDLEEVMFFLESLMEMNQYNLHAFPFLKDVPRHADTPTLNDVKAQAKSAINNLREHVHTKCSSFEEEDIFNFYEPLFNYTHSQNGGRILIFTTNYDFIIEYLFLDDSYRNSDALPELIDGFRYAPGVGEILDDQVYNQSLLDGKEGIYLFKLHGSLGWRYHPRLRTTIIKLSAEERSENSILVYPTKVKRISTPFKELYDIFLRFLQNAEELIIIGCSLRDLMLKDICILRAHKENPTLTIHLCDPKAKELQKDLKLPNCKTHEIKFGSPEFVNLVQGKFRQKSPITKAAETITTKSK